MITSVDIWMDCDDCTEEEFFELDHLPAGRVEGPAVEAALNDKGWATVDGKHLCYDCREKRGLVAD